MRLLVFIHSLASGGAERVTTNLANHWADQGWQITIVTLESREKDFYKLHPSVQRIALELAEESVNSLVGLINNVRRIRALRNILHREQPDIAFSMMSASNIILAFSALGLPGLVAIGSERIHPPELPLGRIWGWLRSKVYRYLAVIIAQTTKSAAWLKENTQARQVVVIPNPISLPLIPVEPIIDPVRFVPNKKRLFLAVGRLNRQKGFDLLISAFAAIASTHRDWSLVILGEGPERAALEEQIKLAGIEDVVILPGRAGNMSAWYERADFYVMSSRFEGFPNTLVEAMAHGLPTVSFNCDTGPRDIIRHEVDGLLVPPNDVNALQQALVQLFENEALRIRFGKTAREVIDRFSMAKIAERWEKLFMSFLSSRES